jgi:hypothetical protein
MEMSSTVGTADVASSLYSRTSNSLLSYTSQGGWTSDMTVSLLVGVLLLFIPRKYGRLLFSIDSKPYYEFIVCLASLSIVLTYF